MKDLARKDVSHKLMIFRVDRKNGGIVLFSRKRSFLKYITFKCL